MGTPRFVYLHPDGVGEDWLYVVVQAPTGVRYQQQYGGYSCRQGQVEGFLVPMTAPGALADLRQLFERDFRRSGTRDHPWSDVELGKLRGIVGDICYWSCDGRDEQPHDLRLDDSRMPDTDEAWVPVITPDGPGVLMWNNSD